MFKARLVLPTLAAAVLCSAAALAQAPAGAPAGSTGTCNDGTYTTTATKSGACGGHKGVKAWYGPAAAAKPSAATPAPAAKSAATPAPVAAAKPSTPAAPATPSKPTPAANIGSQNAGSGAGKATVPTAAAAGGGPGMVWVNTPTKVYHCPTDRYYGKTKQGKYISEQAAIAEGDKADAGKKCF